MPKDEFDFDDPLELTGVGLLCEEDTSEAMAECFIEEFMRLGYNPKQLLALFRNPHYLGLNLVLENRGDAFVRDKIAEVFARWGRPCVWRSQEREGPHPPGPPAVSEAGGTQAGIAASRPGTPSLNPADPSGPPAPPDQTIPLDASATDPLGVPIPRLL
jgi:hypothetical protein